MASDYTEYRGVLRLDVEGLDLLRKKLDGLPKKIENNAVAKTLRAGGAVYRKQIRANARALKLSPTAKKVLARNVLLRVRRSSRSGSIFARVMIKKPDRRTELKQDAFFWKWVEYGTVQRFREIVEVGGAAFGTVARVRRTTVNASSSLAQFMQERGVQGGARGYTGRIVAQPFVRPAIKQAGSAAAQEMIRVAEAEIAKILAAEGFGK